MYNMKITTYTQYEKAVDEANELEEKEQDGLATPEDIARMDALWDAVTAYEDREERDSSWRRA